MRPKRVFAFGLLTGLLLLAGLAAVSLQAAPPPEPPEQLPKYAVRGPVVDQVVSPVVWNGDLRDLPQLPQPAPEPAQEIPLRRTPGELRAPRLRGGVQESIGPYHLEGQMPPPIITFPGVNFSQSACNCYPPDTNGDVGPNHYIQTVNVAIGVFDKTNGAPLSIVSYNAFFPSGTGACDNGNFGDPIVLYDPMVDRWLISDFTAFGGANYECVAVSQTGDPVAGGWYYYTIQTYPNGDFFPDYPKLSVWPDAYYMTDNMFGQGAHDGEFFVRAWAFDRARMLAGQPFTPIYFDTCLQGECGSLLPSNLRGALPPTGSPNYFASAEAPDVFNIWEFHVDWTNPISSTFTGPTQLSIQPFEPAGGVSQPGTSQQLDSLSFRLMHWLQYRKYDTHEALFANHSVDVNGMVVPKWYEIRDPGGSPYVYQEGVFMPDNIHHRWMGSIAADRDGNIALGYSISSSSLYPSIRYAGQRKGEMLGQLPQNEAILWTGGGSQLGSAGRWGDYSAMTVDPTDDCTFWYTNEYYISTANVNWQTRIGAFKFPACGQTLGTVTGRVLNAVTGEPVIGAPVVVSGTVEALTVQTNANGIYTASVLPGAYSITAGPLLPGYPTPAGVTGINVVAGQTTTAPDILLNPVPYLDFGYTTVHDCDAGGNCNGYPDPGEQNLGLTVGLSNIGATTATNINSTLTALTAGVTVQAANSAYPNIPAGQTAANSSLFRFSVDSSVACGAVLQFRENVATAQGSYTVTFGLPTNIPTAPVAIFTDTVEMGNLGWTTSGTSPPFQITTESSHSPTHSWTDSPGGNYTNNQNKSLISPIFDLTGKYNIRFTGWYQYALEAGYDYVYLEYSTNGGASWNTTDPLFTFNGVEPDWTEIGVDAPQLANVAQARLRFHFTSDAGVVADGIHIDDMTLSYRPIICNQPLPIKLYLPIISRN